MPALNSLVTQPGNAEPPNVQGTSGSGQASGLQSLLGGGGAQQGGGMQGPSHQETVALLQHISAFRRRWAKMLNDPEVGTKNMRPEVYDMMADMMGQGYCSLPEVMGLLKTVPTEPLEQKQWIEEHVQNDDKAARMILAHHAMTEGPLGDVQSELGKLQAPVGDRANLVQQAVGRYKAHSKRQGPAKKQGIPIRG